MLDSVRPYMGKNLVYTVRAAVAITIAVILSVVPYFFLYQIIAPLIAGENLAFETVMFYVALTAMCLVGNAWLYVHGLSLSHLSAYNTLKNLRTALQGRLEAQPLGAIRDLGNGRGNHLRCVHAHVRCYPVPGINSAQRKRHRASQHVGHIRVTRL